MAKPKARVDARETRRALARAVSTRFLADFKKHGIETIQRVREEDPSQYLRIAVNLLPKDIDLEVSHSFSDMLREAAKVIEGEVIREHHLSHNDTPAIEHKDKTDIPTVINELAKDSVS